jgi:hypothetical protein
MLVISSIPFGTPFVVIAKTSVGLVAETTAVSKGFIHSKCGESKKNSSKTDKMLTKET